MDSLVCGLEHSSNTPQTTEVLPLVISSEKTEQPGFTSVTLSLSSHDSINTFDFKPSFRLDYTVRLEKHTLFVFYNI